MQNKYLESYKIFKNNLNFFEEDINNPPFVFYKGEKNIIFSCPHAVSQLRNGRIKVADSDTGPLGLALNNLGYPVLIKTKNCNDDANYDKKNDYKSFLIKKIKQEKYAFCVDLHEMAPTRKVLISLGTNFGKNDNKILQSTNLFLKIANKNDLPVNLMRVDFPFSAGFKNTVSTYINKHTNVPTLQVEINAKLFQTKKSLINLIKTLDEYATYLQEYFNNTIEKLSYSDFLKLDDEFFNQKFDKKQVFIFKKTKLKSNILISSPHSSKMVTEGKLAYGETQSGALAMQIANKLNLNYLCKIKSTDYDSTPEYIQKLSDVVLKNKIKFVLEFHIMNKKRCEDITLVINKGNSINFNFELFANILKVLTQNNLTNVTIDYPFNAENLDSTVSVINKKTQAFALQIIINERLVLNKKLYNNLIIALQQIILDLKIYNEFLTI